MPRNPEWVQPKSYTEWKPNIKGPLKLKRSEAEEKSGKPGKPGKVRDTDTPGKPGTPGKQGTPRKTGGVKELGGPSARRTGGKSGSQPQGPSQGPSGRRTRPPGSATPRISGPKAPGQDVVLGNPRPQWGGFAEVIRPTPIASRPAAPPRSHPSVPVRELPAGRQFTGRELPPAPVHSFEGTRIGEMERRRKDIADLVRQVQEQKAQKGLDAGASTGEVVSPGATSQRAAGRDHSIWDAEVVGHNEGKNTGEIRAIAPPSHDARTGPIPRIRTDDTTRLRPARRGDTSSFEPISGNLILPEGSKTGPDHEATSGFQVIRGDVHPERIGLTRHAEPFGQMSLFPGPERERNLSEAQSGREERQAITPPSMPPGRQVNFMQPHLPKKPGSQGTLFKPVTFKTL